MQTSSELIALFREKLGETIAAGGDSSESMFSDNQLTVILERSATIDHALLDGWETKLAHWAGLVTVVDGAATRELSKLMEHGEKMTEYYRRKLNEGVDGIRSRTRIGKIVRSQ